jgi:NADPH:quinone reductase-like Zn-dependent oxidoreductase
VKVRAFSLNFGDLLCVQGLYPTMPAYPFTPGFEACGEVLEVGEQATGFAPGDRVAVGMGDALGGQSSLLLCEADQAAVIPASLSYADAAALPGVTVTMLDAFAKAQLQPGEHILIQTATGGTGLIAVQLAQNCGASIIATAGSEEKLAYLRDLGVKQLINYRQQDFEREVMAITAGRGVDVVINTLAGDALVKGLRVLASGGRYIELAMTGLKRAQVPQVKLFRDGRRFFSVDLRRLSKTSPERVAEYRRTALELADRGLIRAVLCGRYAFSDIGLAYEALQNRSNIGKLVVEIDD